MSETYSKELAARFKDFARKNLRGNNVVMKRETSRFFERLASNTEARIYREDSLRPMTQGSTRSVLETQWIASSAGRWWNRRYYLVALSVIGDMATQMIHYELVEYRFAGVGKFKRDPDQRRRRLLMVNLDQHDSLYYLSGTDTGWTGRERHFDRTKVLSRFNEHLQF